MRARRNLSPRLPSMEGARTCWPTQHMTHTDRLTVPRLLTQPEAAQRLGVHVRTLRRLREDGLISAVKMGRAVRYQPEELARFIRDSSTPRDGGRPNA